MEIIKNLVKKMRAENTVSFVESSESSGTFSRVIEALPKMPQNIFTMAGSLETLSNLLNLKPSRIVILCKTHEQIANLKSQLSNSAIEFIAGDLEDYLATQKKTFDLIHLADALETMSPVQQQNVFKLAARGLSMSGGITYISGGAYRKPPFPLTLQTEVSHKNPNLHLATLFEFSQIQKED